MGRFDPPRELRELDFQPGRDLEDVPKGNCYRLAAQIVAGTRFHDYTQPVDHCQEPKCSSQLAEQWMELAVPVWCLIRHHSCRPMHVLTEGQDGGACLVPDRAPLASTNNLASLKAESPPSIAEGGCAQAGWHEGFAQPCVRPLGLTPQKVALPPQCRWVVSPTLIDTHPPSQSASFNNPLQSNKPKKGCGKPLTLTLLETLCLPMDQSRGFPRKER